VGPKAVEPAHLLEEGEVALLAVAEVEIRADVHFHRTKRLDQDTINELAGRPGGHLGAEGNDQQQVKAEQGKKTGLLVNGHQQGRGRLGADHFLRMGIEGDQHTLPADLAAAPENPVEDQPVALVQTVKVADGDHRGTVIPPLPHQPGQVFHLEILEHIHVGTLTPPV